MVENCLALFTFFEPHFYLTSNVVESASLRSVSFSIVDFSFKRGLYFATVC
jgi:hypothetical protein